MKTNTPYIETDALVLAYEADAKTLDEHLKQFAAIELIDLQVAAQVLMKACGRELTRRDIA